MDLDKDLTERDVDVLGDAPAQSGEDRFDDYREALREILLTGSGRIVLAKLLERAGLLQPVYNECQQAMYNFSLRLLDDIRGVDPAVALQVCGEIFIPGLIPANFGRKD